MEIAVCTCTIAFSSRSSLMQMHLRHFCPSMLHDSLCSQGGPQIQNTLCPPEGLPPRCTSVVFNRLLFQPGPRIIMDMHTAGLRVAGHPTPALSQDKMFSFPIPPLPPPAVLPPGAAAHASPRVVYPPASSVVAALNAAFQPACRRPDPKSGPPLPEQASR